MRPDQLQGIENADTVYILEAGIYHSHAHPFPTESGIMQFDTIQHFDLPFSISVFFFQRYIRGRKTDLLIIFLGRSHIVSFPYPFYRVDHRQVFQTVGNCAVFTGHDYGRKPFTLHHRFSAGSDQCIQISMRNGKIGSGDRRSRLFTPLNGFFRQESLRFFHCKAGIAFIFQIDTKTVTFSGSKPRRKTA